MQIAGAWLSAVLLRNGEFVACVYKGLVDDFAQRAVRSMALKVVKSARKKFSKLIINAYERDASAWDYYCYGVYKGNSAFRDKFISDFIRLSLLKQIDALPDENRRLIEISACSLFEIDEGTVLDRDAVISLVSAEIQTLTLEHGSTLQQFHIASPDRAILAPSLAQA